MLSFKHLIFPIRLVLLPILLWYCHYVTIFWPRCKSTDLPWWPSCLDRGALNNVDAQGCGTSVVRGPTGHK